MSRALLLCTLLIAACQPHLAVAATSAEDLPVPGGRSRLAATLNMQPVPDRARFMSEAVRLLYGRSDRKAIDIDALVLRLRQPQAAGTDAGEVVPVPLTAAVWGEAIFRRRVAPADVILAILTDRQAAFLCYGLSGLDDETLQYLGEHKRLLTQLYLESAPLFAVFAGHIHIRDGRVQPPGGDLAVPLWEAIVGQPVTRPDQFLLALFAQAEGRTAYLYDTIGQLDRARQRFALGLAIDDSAARLAGMRALAAAWIAFPGEWRARVQPFARQPFDLAAALMRISADADGRPTAPASRGFWSRAFDGSDLPDDSAKELASREDRPVEAADLLGLIVAGDIRVRADRLDQFAFGQRVFSRASSSELPDVLVAVRAFRRYRMLMVTLERMGIRSPSLYAAAARVASRMSPSDPARSFVATAQFQGALALLTRMRIVGTLDQANAEKLVASLVAVPLNQYAQYLGGVVRWLGEELRPAIAPADTLEGTVLNALAGPELTSTAPVIEWEGQRYRVDLTAAERGRLARVRDRQAGPTLDLALDLAAAAGALTGAPPTVEAARAVGTRLKTTSDDLRTRARRAALAADGFPSGVVPPPEARDRVAKALDEIGRMTNASKATRTTRAAIEVVDAADEVAAQTLVSWAYATDIGDIDGMALIVGDISRRHDFGFGQRDTDARLRAAWALPRPDVAPGVPWHVDGSLLGLDVGLAAAALRRLGADRSLDAPTLTSNERETFAAGFGLMNASTLTDATRDAIAAAVARGRRRVLLAMGPAEVDRLATEIQLDGRRRRELHWTFLHERAQLISLLSLHELVWLGDGSRQIDLDPWGTSAMISTGCVCTLMPRPGQVPMLTGRPQIGLLATAVPDLNLRVASVLAELHLPARLAKHVLAAAVQDFVDRVRPSDPDDWLTLVRTGSTVTREQIEDYVAAAAADGPLVPESR